MPSAPRLKRRTRTIPWRSALLQATRDQRADASDPGPPHRLQGKPWLACLTHSNSIYWEVVARTLDNERPYIQ